MVQINHLLGIKKLFIENQPRKLDLPQKEISLLEQGGGLDTVSFSSNKSEKFADVRAELDKNVPDRTTTIEEKEKALSYIERMLKCDDITPEMKNYWTNKKNVIEMEIQSIKNEQQVGKNEKWEDVAKEFSDFTDKYWNKNPKFDSVSDRVEYWVTYSKTCQSYIQRILECNDLPNNMRENYMAEYSNHQFDIDNHLRDLERYRQEQN